jgi:hypothetical protein
MSRKPGDLILKDPQSVEPYTFDWTAYLAELGDDVLIEDSELFIDPVGAESPAVLVIDDDSILDGGRKVQLWYSGGTKGMVYILTSRITTNSTPPVTDDRSVKIKVTQRWWSSVSWSRCYCWWRGQPASSGSQNVARSG